MSLPDWWARERFGLLVHSSLGVVPAWAPVGEDPSWYSAHCGASTTDTLLHPAPMAETLAHHRERWAHVESPTDFLPFLDFDGFDPDEWAALARAAGATYTVMIAKHHDGLCWWDAPGTDFTVTHHGPRRDVLAAYSAACERAGLVFGTQYSLLDWADSRYPDGTYVDEVVHRQVLDLVERYGTRLLWGDGHWGAGGDHWRSDELLERASRLDPEIVANDRWWAEGQRVVTHERDLPSGIVEHDWEFRRGIGRGLAYNRAETSEHLLDAHDIVALLTEVVAKGGHLLLSVGTDGTGEVPEAYVPLLNEAGRWVKRHRRLVDAGTPWSTWGDVGSRYLVESGTLHAIDIDGSGSFPDIVPQAGRVTSVTDCDGRPYAFEHDRGGLRIDRRRSDHRSATDDRMPTVFAVELESPPPDPVVLFPVESPTSIHVADLLDDARPGDVVQLGDGTYLGPARVPAGVTVRGLGADRTVIDGMESCAITLAEGARLEHCSVSGGGDRIVWLPRVAVRIDGSRGTVLGCHVDGHVEIRGADDARITSCTLTGAVVADAQRAAVLRSGFSGMQWDCAVDITGGSGHVVESCAIDDVLQGVRLTNVVASTVRANRIAARWWGVQLVDTQGCVVAANAFDRTMRAVDVDGGSQATVTGNAVADGDSGCLVQRGASGTEVSGNRWERCRIGLLAWDTGPFSALHNTAIDLGEPDGASAIGPS